VPREGDLAELQEVRLDLPVRQLFQPLHRVRAHLRVRELRVEKLRVLIHMGKLTEIWIGERVGLPPGPVAA
jgi:hypothetical protein